MAKHNRYNPNPKLGYRASGKPITTASLRRQEGSLLLSTETLSGKRLQGSQSYIANKGSKQGKTIRIPASEAPRAEHINPERNQDQDFYTKPLNDLHAECVSLVNALKSGRNDKPARIAYVDAMQSINLCPRCASPFKVKQGLIDTRQEGFGAVKEIRRRNKSFRLAPSDKYIRKDSKRGLNYSERILGKKQVRRGIFELKLRAPQYSHRIYNSDSDSIYADIPSHYEVRRDKRGNPCFVYIDGTGRDIRLERVRKECHLEKCSRCLKMRDKCGCRSKQVLQPVTKVYFQKQLMCEGLQVFPPKSYRITGQRCECWK